MSSSIQFHCIIVSSCHRVIVSCFCCELLLVVVLWHNSVAVTCDVWHVFSNFINSLYIPELPLQLHPRTVTKRIVVESREVCHSKNMLPKWRGRLHDHFYAQENFITGTMYAHIPSRSGQQVVHLAKQWRSY